MKKAWVEVRVGEVVEISAIRSISAGENLHNDLAESTALHVRYVGDRKKSRIDFATVEDKWKGYELLVEGLTKISTPESGK